MPCVKWGIGTRYCRSFQRRHSICPIRVSCITGSPGLNRVKWNRIEQYRIVFDRGMSALRPDFPSRSIRCSVLSSFPYSIKGGGGGGFGRLLRANADRGVRSRAGNIWAKDPKEDFREFKATVSAYTRMSKVFGTDYC